MDFETTRPTSLHTMAWVCCRWSSYSETSGIPFDGCDTVSAAIPPAGPAADWGNANSVLTGTSDDCSDIVLTVVVFPAYTGEAMRVAGGEASDHEAAWSSQTRWSGNVHP